MTSPAFPGMHAGMYIKRVQKSHCGSKKRYEYLHLVENLHTEHGPHQRLFLNLNLGTEDVAPEHRQIYARLNMKEIPLPRKITPAK